MYLRNSKSWKALAGKLNFQMTTIASTQCSLVCTSGYTGGRTTPPPCWISHKVRHIIAQLHSTLNCSTWSVSRSLGSLCAGWGCACCLNHTDWANVSARRLPRHVFLNMLYSLILPYIVQHRLVWWFVQAVWCFRSSICLKWETLHKLFETKVAKTFFFWISCAISFHPPLFNLFFLRFVQHVFRSKGRETSRSHT